MISSTRLPLSRFSGFPTWFERTQRSELHSFTSWQQPATRTESPNVNDVTPQPIPDADLAVPTIAKRIPAPVEWLLKPRLPVNLMFTTADRHIMKHLALGDTFMLRAQESQIAACRRLPRVRTIMLAQAPLNGESRWPIE